MDDVFLFGSGSLKDWETFHDIIKIFCEVPGMDFSMLKSNLLKNGADEEVLNQVLNIFPFKFEPIEKGFKYLG